MGTHMVAQIGSTWKTFVPMGGLGGACRASKTELGQGEVGVYKSLINSVGFGGFFTEASVLILHILF